MKNNPKKTKASLIISIIALVVAAINLIFSSVNKLQIASAVTIFCATIVICGVNLTSYKSQQNNDKNSDK